MHIRSLTLSLIDSAYEFAYPAPIGLMDRWLPNVRSIQLQLNMNLTALPLSINGIDFEHARRRVALLSAKTIMALPSSLLDYAVRCPEVERALQLDLDNILSVHSWYIRRIELFGILGLPAIEFMPARGPNLELCKLKSLQRDEIQALFRQYPMVHESYIVHGKRAIGLEDASNSAQDVAFVQFENRVCTRHGGRWGVSMTALPKSYRSAGCRHLNVLWQSRVRASQGSRPST